MAQWIKGRAKTSFKKYVPLTLLQGFEKGYSRFACERELETEQNCNILTPTHMAISVVSFSFSWCSTGGPGAQLSAECWFFLPHLVTNGSPKLLGAPRAPSAGSGFPYHILSATSLDPNSSGAPMAPSAWCGFPYHILSITRLISNCLTSVLTELYNTSTPTQSPTQSLEWHV